MEETKNQGHERPLCFKDAYQFLNLSKSYLYKLTHKRLIPHYKPNGKKVYFLKSELWEWLLRNPVKTESQIEQEAIDYITTK